MRVGVRAYADTIHSNMTGDLHVQFLLLIGSLVNKSV